jgi:hypothetical protein
MTTHDIAALRVARALHEGVHGEALADKVQEIVLELGLSNTVHLESAAPRPSDTNLRSSSRNIIPSPYPSIGKRCSPRRGEIKSFSTTAELDATIALSEHTGEVCFTLNIFAFSLMYPSVGLLSTFFAQQCRVHLYRDLPRVQSSHVSWHQSCSFNPNSSGFPLQRP